jgi:hypothetical protein
LTLDGINLTCFEPEKKTPKILRMIGCPASQWTLIWCVLPVRSLKCSRV